MVYDATAVRKARRDKDPDALFTFAWDGVEYVVRNPSEWPVVATDLIAEGLLHRALCRLLDDAKPGQAALWEQSTGAAVDDAQGILVACAEHFGVSTSLGG